MLRVRNEAKTNLRRFVDDVLFVVTKESRDRLKAIQRQLRDHYREIANQTTRSLNESLQSTLAAARVQETERASRITELERQANILRQVIDNAEANSRRDEAQRPGARDPRRCAAGLPVRPGLPGAPGGAWRVAPHRGPPQRADPHRAGRHPESPASRPWSTPWWGSPSRPPTPPRPPGIVTWFRHGPTPKVTANHVGGRRTNVPDRARPRPSGRPDVSSSAALTAADVVDLDVEWPAAELTDATIIDTPGTSSLTRDVSERTLRLLVPEDGVPRVDAVVFLLRTLNAADIALLKQIGELVGGSAGALG